MSDQDYTPPTYRFTLPNGDAACSLCGAAVLNQHAHDEWHVQLWFALLKAMRP